MTKIFCLFFLCITAKICTAQTTSDGESVYRAAIQNTIERYHRSRNGDAAIYNGMAHLGYLPSIKGTAYFQSANWQTGTVVYNQMEYNNITLKYDEVADQVVVRQPTSSYILSLFSPRVQRFSLGSAQFIYLNDGVPTGFYQLLERGKMTILAKRTKVINETISGIELERNFDSSTKFYALTNGTYYPIEKQKSILALLKDQRKKIQQHLKSKGIKFKSNPEMASLEMAAYYNELTNQ
jgi:hypothetical protein